MSKTTRAQGATVTHATPPGGAHHLPDGAPRTTNRDRVREQALNRNSTSAAASLLVPAQSSGLQALQTRDTVVAQAPCWHDRQATERALHPLHPLSPSLLSTHRSSRAACDKHTSL